MTMAWRGDGRGNIWVRSEEPEEQQRETSSSSTSDWVCETDPAERPCFVTPLDLLRSRTCCKSAFG